MSEQLDQMNKIETKLEARSRRKSEKRELKRRELAKSTAMALSTLGYVNTSLRDIAEQSGNALGTLHYYFEDRVDLITFTVALYKRAFLDELRTAAEGSESIEDVINNLSAGLSHGVTYHADEHKLWFDIRNQAAFDPAFEKSISEIEGEIIDVFSKVERHYFPGRSAATLDYTAVDGLFRYIMQSKEAKHRDFDANSRLFREMLGFLWLN